MKRLELKAIAGLFCLMMGLMIFPALSKAYEENGFKYRVSEKKAYITEGKILGTTLEIPETLGGFTVAGIQSYAFRKSTYTEVKMPNTITSIGSYAFSESKKLQSIYLSNKLKKIDNGTFCECNKLSKISGGVSVKSINFNAFEGCISLKSLVLPKKLEYIKSWAFKNCYKLKSIKLYNKLNLIDEEAFLNDYDLKSIIIPASVDVIGNGAFKRCSDLKSVKFKGKNTKLHKEVFYSCSSLRKTILPENSKSVPEKTFAKCSSLKEVSLPGKVSIIKRRAFADCTGLKKVELGSKIYAIGDGAFEASGLRSIKLNDKLQFIGNGAFKSTNVRSIKLGNKVTFIGNKVFSNCTKLKTILIPASVKGINPGAFNNCSSLRAINVASGNKAYSSQAGVLYNSNKTKLIQYPLHKSNASYSTPGSLDRIRSNAFRGNSYLKNVSIQANTIGGNAFADMENLRSVKMTRVKKIGYKAFNNDTKLTNVVIPDTVTGVGNNAFEYSNINSIHIPSGLTKLGSNVFSECNNLAEFTGGRGGHYCVEEGVLYNSSKSKLIKYPAKKATASFTVPNSVRSVNAHAFENNKKIVKLYFEKNMRSLSYDAIINAKSLKSIVFNARKLSYSSEYGISNCDKLAVIVGANTYTMRQMAKNANATLITL